MKKGRSKAELLPTDAERSQLQSFAGSRSGPAALSMRACIILDSASGGQNKDIAEQLKPTQAKVGRWRSRFVARRIASP